MGAKFVGCYCRDAAKAAKSSGYVHDLCEGRRESGTLETTWRFSALRSSMGAGKIDAPSAGTVKALMLWITPARPYPKIGH